jgi:AraC-like DNA-binding protein
MRQTPRAKPQRQDWALCGRDDPTAGDQYRAQVRSLFDIELHQPPAEFHNRLEACNLETMVFGRCAGVAQTFTRSLAHIRADGLDQVQAILDLSGEWRGDYDGRAVSSEMGALRIVDMARPFRVTSSDFETLNLMIPRTALGEAGGADLHGLVIGETTAGARFLTSLLRSLWASLDEITVEEGVAATRAVAALLEGLIVEHRQPPPVAIRPFGAIVFGMARDLVDSRLGDPDLSPEHVREHLGVSRTTLYALFEKAGGVQAFIQARRLDRAFETLARSDGGMSVAEVGYACGFRSAAHFSRAFSQRFKRPPSHLARLRGRSEPPPVAEGLKAVIDWFERTAKR